MFPAKCPPVFTEGKVTANTWCANALGPGVSRLCPLSSGPSASPHLLPFFPTPLPDASSNAHCPPVLINRQVEESSKEFSELPQRAMLTSIWVASSVWPCRQQSGQEDFFFCLQAACELRSIKRHGPYDLLPGLSELWNFENCLFLEGRHLPAGSLVNRRNPANAHRLPGRGITFLSSKLRFDM